MQPRELPPIVDTVFPNGARLLTLTRRALPIASLRIVLARGAADASSVAPFAASMLFKGTAQDTGLGIRQALSEMGATFGASALYEGVVIEAKVPSENVLPALDILFRAFRLSNFPPEELESVRRVRIARLERAAAEPSIVADRVLGASLYPQGNPYHDSAEGDVDSTRRVVRQDLLGWWQAVAKPQATTFIVVGDVDANEIAARLRSWMADWTGDAPPWRSPVAPAPPKHSRVVVVDRPADSQCAIRFGWLVADRASAEIPVLRVLSAWLASGIIGRLDRVLRLEHGETYDVRSWVSARIGASPFVIAAAVERERAEHAVREVAAEVERVRGGQALTDSDSPTAHSLFVSAAWQPFETNGEAAEELTAPALRAESVDVFLRHFRALAAMQGEDIRRAAAQYLTPDSRVIVVLGDAAHWRPALESAGLGEIAVVQGSGI